MYANMFTKFADADKKVWRIYCVILMYTHSNFCTNLLLKTSTISKHKPIFPPIHATCQQNILTVMPLNPNSKTNNNKTKFTSGANHSTFYWTIQTLCRRKRATKKSINSTHAANGTTILLLNMVVERTKRIKCWTMLIATLSWSNSIFCLQRTNFCFLRSNCQLDFIINSFHQHQQQNT